MVSFATRMSAEDFDLPPELEALLQEVCAEQNVPRRRQDELRLMLQQPESSWPRCCGGGCVPCVEDQTAIAREILARRAAQGLR